MIESLLALVTGQSLLFLLAGVLLGLVFGAIPGLSATLAVIVLIPVTYTLQTSEGMALLIGSYVGGMSGGYVASILLNMPGTPATVASCFDGFPLAKKGQAGKALGVGTFSNLFGSLFGWVCLLLFGGALSAVATSFGAFEMTAAIIFAFAAVISLSGRAPLKPLIAVMLGLALSCFGYDSVSGMERATFGLGFLQNGLNYMPALIGLFVVAEIFNEVEEIGVKYVIPHQKIQHTLMTLSEIKAEFVNLVRSSAIGVLIGLLPGIGGSFANFITYDQAKKHAKHPEEYGKGNIGGVVASEAGAQATVGGALVPFIALGIPGDTVTAALLGGLLITGIAPGPLFVTEHPDVVYTIYNSVFVAAIATFIVMQLVGIRTFPRILRLPKYVLLPVVAAFALAGTYNMNYSVGDVWATLAFGLVGYAMGKIDLPKTPLVIAMILGGTLETRLRTAMTLSGGSLLPFVTQPFALVFVLATIATIAAPYLGKRLKARKGAGLAGAAAAAAATKSAVEGGNLAAVESGIESVEAGASVVAAARGARAGDPAPESPSGGTPPEAGAGPEVQGEAAGDPGGADPPDAR